MLLGFRVTETIHAESIQEAEQHHMNKTKTISNALENLISNSKFDEKVTFLSSNGFTKSISNPEFSKSCTKMRTGEAFYQITVPNRWERPTGQPAGCPAG